MADKVLAAIGVETSAAGRRRCTTARLCSTAGWSTPPTPTPCPAVEAAGIAARAVPLLMTDLDATTAMAREALALAEQVRESR